MEDEASIADTLIYSLETEGFTVRWFDRGLPVLAALESEQPAFLILDVGLPDINGFELCRRLLSQAGVYPTSFSKYGACYQQHILNKEGRFCA